MADTSNERLAELIHWMSPGGYGDTCEFLKELQVRRASDVSQSDIDTLQDIIEETSHNATVAKRSGRDDEHEALTDNLAALTRILTALRSR